VAKERIENLKLSNQSYDAEFERIGKMLYPIRQKRHTGEPARADHREIRDLITQLTALRRVADAARDLLEAKHDPSKAIPYWIFYENDMNDLQNAFEELDRLGSQPQPAGEA
jgi:hypothetical protein